VRPDPPLVELGLTALQNEDRLADRHRVAGLQRHAPARLQRLIADARPVATAQVLDLDRWTDGDARVVT
jgi:hypothetical protein